MTLENQRSSTMPHPCVVCGRSRMNPNNREEEYMFFSFPVNDEARCRRWLEFCGREDLYKLSKKQLLQRMVCSKHFQPQDFLTDYLDRLNSTAVPSIYDPTQSLYNITCVICSRSRKDPPGPEYIDDGTTFHHFPGEEFRCLKWLEFVGVESYYRLTRKEILFCYICSNHFDRSQFVSGYKGRLVENAVPTIREPKPLDESQLDVTELAEEPKLFGTPERSKKELLPNEVLESQACAACGRSRSDPRNKRERYKFHPFPAYEIGRCLRWCQFLGREDLLSMSPNQIRKLVLCSRHFQAGQKFYKAGPCDAVPTIKDVSESEVFVISENDEEQDDGDETKEGKDGKRFSRPLVSSKKPKVDNKPAPLAKKRGKSRRPTSINIPRPNFSNLDDRVVKKLPLPPSMNWKIQLSEQLQPVTVNNAASNVSNSQTDGLKKVIMPLTWDISSLGAPIPVNSLSSMPPGLLIKIELPEQEQPKEQKPMVIKKQNKATDKAVSKKQTWLKNNGQTSAVLQKVKSNANKNLTKLLPMSSDPTEDILDSNEIDVQEEVVLPPALEIIGENDEELKEDQYFRQLKATPIKRKKIKRKKMTDTMRRTLFPITNEVNRFLTKLTPLMHRLPKRARAQIKLSIVNMVIDQL